MLARLYNMPDAGGYYRRALQERIAIRRADPWHRSELRAFIERQFSRRWADETEQAFAQHPITAFVAMREQEIVGFGAYECTRRGYFGPTGVLEELRGKGVGAALLFRCLDSMAAMGYAYAIIGGVYDAQPFYEKVCGAYVIPGSERGIYG